MALRTAPLLLVLLALAGCRGEGPEARIHRAFEAGRRAVEAGDGAGASQLLAPGFSGPDGMDRAGARLYLTAVLGRQKVGVTVLGDRLEVQGQRATQRVELLLTGRAGQGLLPDESSRRELVIRWECRDGAWRIREVE